jgi:hypothetical protein
MDRRKITLSATLGRFHKTLILGNSVKINLFRSFGFCVYRLDFT